MGSTSTCTGTCAGSATVIAHIVACSHVVRFTEVLCDQRAATVFDVEGVRKHAVQLLETSPLREHHAALTEGVCEAGQQDNVSVCVITT